MNKSISIIGGGNLGSSIAEGILDSKLIPANQLIITRRKLEKIQYLADRGAQITSDNLLATENADIIILAIKPYQILEILREIKHNIRDNKIIVSTVTGISLKEMREIIPKGGVLFRAMPNTAIAIRQSMTCIASDGANEAAQKLVEDIFKPAGEVIFLEENLMNASTALAACGIAFALRFIRAASQGGIEIGFDSETAQKIAAQTAKGAASLILEHNYHPEREIDKVTTPKGCTIAGLNEMEHNGFSSALIKGILASFKEI